MKQVNASIVSKNFLDPGTLKDLQAALNLAIVSNLSCDGLGGRIDLRMTEFSSGTNTGLECGTEIVIKCKKFHRDTIKILLQNLNDRAEDIACAIHRLLPMGQFFTVTIEFDSRVLGYCRFHSHD